MQSRSLQLRLTWLFGSRRFAYDEWLTVEVDDVDVRFLFELIERRYTDKSTVLCTQYEPAEWHELLGGGVQADAMCDRLIHGAVRIDLGDVNVRKLLARKDDSAR